MKNKKYHTVGTISKSNIKIETTNTQIHPCLGMATSINVAGLNY
jgi:hypothetical protein